MSLLLRYAITRGAVIITRIRLRVVYAAYCLHAITRYGYARYAKRALTVAIIGVTHAVTGAPR